MFEKKLIRKSVRAKLAAMSLEDRVIKNAAITARFLSSPEYKSARTIFFYFSTEEEADTRASIRHALVDGKQVFLPRTEGDDMCFVPYVMGDKLELNPTYCVEEPVGEATAILPDLVVIPLIAFDKDKHRLGRGKGYYDRFLKGFTGTGVALAFSEQECDRVPMEEFDLSPQVIITDKERIE